MDLDVETNAEQKKQEWALGSQSKGGWKLESRDVFLFL